MGMEKAEISRKFDEIVDFSGVEKFIDTPVKRYSSGMYVRLAFAVAAHLDPEILVVDEVLAVGDAEFQKKCLGKMGDVAHEGRTVLFVSHNMAAVRKLCSHSLLLEKGSVLMTDTTDLVIDHYLDVRAGLSSAIITLPKKSDLSNEMGRGLSLFIKDEQGNLRDKFKIGEKWVIRLEFEIQKHLKNVIAGIGITTSESIALTTYWSQPADLTPGYYYANFLCDLPLKATHISITVGLSEHERSFYYVEDVGSFEVAQVSVADQPFRSAGSGLLLGNQDSIIYPITR
jgi:lipopolysaccharide transport system ATP-binding protein